MGRNTCLQEGNIKSYEQNGRQRISVMIYTTDSDFHQFCDLVLLELDLNEAKKVWHYKTVN